MPAPDLSVGSIWQAVVSELRQHFWTLFAIAAPFTLLVGMALTQFGPPPPKAIGDFTPRVLLGLVLLPALGKVWPALSSQIIIVMLGSAVCSQIATEELSFAANFIQSRNFRAFETYALTTLIYLCMALLIRQLLNWIGRRYISRSRSSV